MLSAQVIATAIESQGYREKVAVSAGEMHTVSPLEKFGKDMTDGRLNQYLENYGFESVEITSVRSGLESFDATWYATACEHNTDFTRYVVVDTDTKEQTTFNSRDELKVAHEQQVGAIPEKFADYCNTQEFTPEILGIGK